MPKYKLYTGPTLVSSVAQRLRDLGVTVTLEGTEHVYADAVSRQRLFDLLPPGGWQLRDVQEVF